MEYTTTKEDLFKRVLKKYSDSDEFNLNECLYDLLVDGEIYEKGLTGEYLFLI